MTTITLNAKQVEVLASLEIDPQDLVFVSGSKIHSALNCKESVTVPNALTNGYHLVFLDEQQCATYNFLHYLGWADRVGLEINEEGLLIYSGVDSEALDCYILMNVNIDSE